MNYERLSDLDTGDVLGSGGQADVVAVKNRPGLVLKRYHNPASAGFNPVALEQLIDHRPHLNLSGVPVDQWAAWPVSIVADSSGVVGFLMPQVDARFQLTIHGKARLADLSYLGRPAAPAWEGAVVLPGQATRCQLLAQLAQIIQAVHHRGLVIGDLSYGNAVWSQSGRPMTFLLDCDGIQIGGAKPVLPQMDTPDWNDPLSVPGSPPDQDRDNYKLSLAVLRVLTQQIDVRPSPQGRYDFADVPDVVGPAITGLLDRASGPVGSRPTAQEWRAALEGRGAVAIRPAGPTSSAPVAGKEHLLYDPNRPRRQRPITRTDPSS